MIGLAATLVPIATGVVVMAYGSPRHPSEIEAYYTDIRRGRPPTPELLAELSEAVAELNADANVKAVVVTGAGQMTIWNLASRSRRRDPILVGAGEENAGIVDIGDGLAIAFKIESHNHPSFIEPYQGAATGVGGILRDVFTMGARPIAYMKAQGFKGAIYQTHGVANNDFLNHRDTSVQGYGYAVFGKVVAGMDVVDKIVSTPRERKNSVFQDVPKTPVTITSVKVVQ